MRTYFECIPCILDQICRIKNRFKIEDAATETLFRRILKFLSETDYSLPPPYTGMVVHRIIREVTGNPDPWKDIKQHFNRLCLDFYPRVKKMVEESKDRFPSSVRVTLAGNIMDFFAGRDLKVMDAITESLTVPLGIDHSELLKKEIDLAKNILYIGDNAGEVVLDRILLEEIANRGEKNIFYGVRGAPVINDATRADAEFAGIDRVAVIIESGSDAPGVILDECSQQFRDIFATADLVISKGQGNYESLCDIEHPNLFFLLMVKCDIITRDIGQPVGTLIVKRKETRNDYIGCQRQRGYWQDHGGGMACPGRGKSHPGRLRR